MVYIIIPVIAIISVDIDNYPCLHGYNVKRFSQLQVAALNAVLITVEHWKASFLTSDD